MEKAKEITLLKQLVNADTYFSATFSQCIDTMINNINSDFDLLCGTCYDNSEMVSEMKKMESTLEYANKEYAMQQEKIKELQKRLEGRTNLVKDLAEYLVQLQESGVGVDPTLFFSTYDIMKAKLRKNIPLNAEEKEIIFSLI